MTNIKEKMKHIKYAIRRKYAWPGGYPLYLVMSDGEGMCIDCGRSNYRLIARETVDGTRGGWRAAAAAINWEDTNLICCHCNKRIESAYGEEDA